MRASRRATSRSRPTAGTGTPRSSTSSGSGARSASTRSRRSPSRWSSTISRSTCSACRRATDMKVEETLKRLELEVSSLEDLYRTNPSGAHYISHYPVQNLLYLSGTTPRRGGQPLLPGVVGHGPTGPQGHDAARYAALPPPPG